MDYAPGIRVVQRVFPSMFDMFGGNRPENPEGFDADAELRGAVDLAGAADVAVVVVGEWQNMIGEAASRSSLELPGRQLELLEAVVGTGTPNGAAGDERRNWTSPRPVGRNELGQCGAEHCAGGNVWWPHSLYTAEATGSTPVPSSG